MMCRFIRRFFLFLLFFLLIQVNLTAAAEPAPNVLILFGNEWTALTQGHKGFYHNSQDYYGYFDPDKYYTYAARTGFAPAGQASNHYVPVSVVGQGDFWSGNFLNWATMANADLVRKTLTGGKRSKDTPKLTRLVRAQIAGGNNWKSTYGAADLASLVPAAYANPTFSFYNTGSELIVQDQNGSPVAEPFIVQVEVCNAAMPEANCSDYGGGYKPEGFLQKFGPTHNFGLMSYSEARPEEGGILRVPLGPVLGEYSQKNGTLANKKGAINFINNFEQKGWGPLAELYYEALRYLKGNEAGQLAYCGSDIVSEARFPVYGCNDRKPWIDPVIDPLQKNSILIVSDEYPSRDMNALPGSALYPNYTDWPMPFGSNTPYNPDTALLTSLVGDAEGITGSFQPVGNTADNSNGLCTPKLITALGDAYGICPSEPSAFSEGSFYTAGLAYSAWTGDLRPDLPGMQSVDTYVLAYRATSNAIYQSTELPMSPLLLAAKYGGFDDRNQNGFPDLKEEWDRDGDGVPFTFYYAEDGRRLINNFNTIFLPMPQVD